MIENEIVLFETKDILNTPMGGVSMSKSDTVK